MDSAWTEGVPPRQATAPPRLEILTPKWGKPVKVVLLGNRIWSRVKHFSKEARVPYVCPAPGKCPACVERHFAYATGWMACCHRDSNRRAILQLSDAAMEAVAGHTLYGTSLRGLHVWTSRKDARANAKMVVQFGELDQRTNLPEEFDVRPTLEVVWGLVAAKMIFTSEMGGAHDTTEARQLRQEGL